MANNIDLTISALECPLGTFQCSAWLIQLRQRTALSPLKRSCFSRFAASEPRTVLSSLCAFLQNARPPGSLRSPSVCAPKPSFRRFRCSAWLILQFRTESAFQAAPVFRSAYSASRNARPPAASRPPSKHTVLFLPKRSCFRFASLTPPELRTVLSFLCAFLQNARPPGSLRSPSEPRTALPFLLH